MTQKDTIIGGVDKDLKQLIDAEMNDPVLGKLLNRNAAYVLGKEIKLVLIDRACEWLRNNWRNYVGIDSDGIICFGHWENDFRKAMKGD